MVNEMLKYIKVYWKQPLEKGELFIQTRAIFHMHTVAVVLRQESVGEHDY